MDFLMQMQEEGMEVPALSRRPTLHSWQVELIEFYFLLARSRPPAFGAIPAAVPITEIRAMYEMLGLQSLYSAFDFLVWMQALDNTLIAHYKEIEDRKPKRKPPR